MRNLVDNLVTIWNDGVQLLKRLQGLVIVVQSLVNQTKVVNCFDAISLDSDGLQEKLFRSIVVLLVVEAVTFIDQGLGIVPVVLDG